MEYFKQINLDFGDFLLLVIILLLLHIISVIELLALTKKENRDIVFTANLKVSTTLTFLGILLTFFCGLAAHISNNGVLDSSLLIVPTVFIILWILTQYRYSKTINLENIHERLKELMKYEIVEYAQNNSPFTLKDLEDHNQSILFAHKIIRNLPLFFPKVSLRVFGIEKLIRSLYFTKNDILEILNSLCKSGDLIESNKGYSYSPNKKNKYQELTL